MENIEARMIIEIMGRPPEHIVKAMEMLLEKLGNEKGVSVINKAIKYPIPVEGAQNLYSTFAEVEAEFDSINTYFGIIFAYLPSNIEIISPLNFKFRNDEISSLGNSLISHLHTYDAIAKGLVAEKDMLARRLQELSGNVPEKKILQTQPKKKTRRKKEHWRKKAKKA